MKKLILLIAFLTAAALCVRAQENKPQLIASFSDSLAHVTTARDSIRIMYNLFDLDSGNRKAHAKTLYDLVERHGTRNEMLDMIRQNVNLNQTDTVMLDRLLTMLEDYAETPEVAETRLYLRLNREENSWKNVDWKQRLDNGEVSGELVKYLNDKSTSQEDRVVNLFGVVTALKGLSSGPLLTMYVDSLQNLVERMNLPVGAVKSYIYTRSSIIFNENGNAEALVRTEKKLLNVMDSLTRAYAKTGRPYRTLPVNRYISYRRLLRNASALNEAEIEQYYKEAIDLAAQDSTLAGDLRRTRMIDIFYLMGKKKYEQALPLIVNQLTTTVNNDSQQVILYTLLYEAAKATGNQIQLRNATEFLYPLCKKELDSSEGYRLNAMRILYQADSIHAASAVSSDMVKARKDSERKTHNAIIIVCIVALLFLAVFILFLVRQRSRVLSMAENLKQTNEHLTRERNELRQAQAELIEARDASKAADRLKTDFINNMTHEITTPLAAINEYSRLIVDCIPDEKRAYLDKFAGIINLNSRLILSLVNDVLDVASLERREMSIVRMPSTAAEACEVAIANVFEESRTGAEGDVRLVYTPLDETVNLLTDPSRVGQVLTNLLSNAKKFTPKGTITLSYALDSDGKHLTFSVADTGIGIPRGMEEEIFSRFRQLDRTVQGTGLGLYISRLLADLLGGTIKVDTTYRGGARFLFTIPTGY